MKTIYNAGIALYATAVKLATCKSQKAEHMIEGQKSVFDYLRVNRKKGERYIWFHAASLGEFEQGRPLIERIKVVAPQYKILLTFFSPSGYEIRKNYEGADLVCYLPFDLPANVAQFLDLASPELAFFIKYEFWANYLNALKQRNIPVYLVSAIFRKEQVFFKSYGGFFRKLLKTYDKIFVQDEMSLQLLKHIQVENAVIAGDTRFDRVSQIMQNAKSLSVIDHFAKDAKFILVAGSTWEPDEDLILSYFNTHPAMKLIIAPHEIGEHRIREIQGKLKRPFVRYSQLLEGNLPDADCLIIDSIGLLSSLYRYGQLAYIGGGFGVGIHNVLEAAVYEVPVIFGPNYHRFREACQLVSVRGAFPVSNSVEFSQKMERLMSDPDQLHVSGKIAGYYVAENSGATELIVNAVFNLK